MSTFPGNLLLPVRLVNNNNIAMAPPSHSFAKLCNSAQPKIVVPPREQQQQFLADSGISSSPNTSVKDLTERCAALAWARASLSSAEDPDSWSTTLDVSLHPTLLGLYLLSPHRGPGVAPSNFARLASTIELYDPTSVAAAGVSAPAARNCRPWHHQHSAPHAQRRISRVPNIRH